jgi:hypothetical protein
MKYMLMDYVQEAGWQTLTKADQEHWLGAYKAYMEAMTRGWRAEEQRWAEVCVDGHDRSNGERESPSARRAVCRVERTTRWLPHH